MKGAGMLVGSLEENPKQLKETNLCQLKLLLTSKRNQNIENRIDIFKFFVCNPKRDLAAKNVAFLFGTPQVRPNSEIYTPK